MHGFNITLVKIPSAIACFLFLAVAGCKKEEGPGGTATIRGKVIVHDFDGGFQLPAPQAIYPAVDERTYIVYGADGATYDDDFRTSYDGSYEYRFLQKGKYSIFSYSKDTTGAYNGTINFNAPPRAVIVEVEITESGSTVTAPDIVILDNNY